MSGTPELQQETSRALDEVEECKVLSNTPALPQVYRNKMRPDRSLIYYFGGFAAPTVISLVALDDKVSVKLWKGGGAYAAKIKSCL